MERIHSGQDVDCGDLNSSALVNDRRLRNYCAVLNWTIAPWGTTRRDTIVSGQVDRREWWGSQAARRRHDFGPKTAPLCAGDSRVVSENTIRRSRGGSMVVLEEPAEEGISR
jgi:hypothetical protein